jgi:hypothetical protein
MGASEIYAQENGVELTRLRALAARLSDADLGRDLGGGWVVATALAHLAFWDRQRQTQLRKWARTGTQPDAGDSECTNAAVEVLANAVPPRVAARLAVEAAEAVAHEVQGLDDDVVGEIERAGATNMLRRAAHWRDHMAQIEAGLSS